MILSEDFMLGGWTSMVGAEEELASQGMLCPGRNYRWDIPSDRGIYEEPTKVSLMKKHQLPGAHLTHLETLIS